MSVWDAVQAAHRGEDVSDGQGGIQGMGRAGPDGFIGSLYNTATGWMPTANRGDNEFRDVGDRNSYNLPGYQQSMERHNALLDQLQGQASGTGPSLANMQMKQGLQSSLAQQQALAQSGRGNPAMAMRQAGINSGNLASQITSQGTMARLAEQRQGQQMLGGALQGQLNAQQAQQQGALQYQNQRGNRFNALTQTPSGEEQKLSAFTSGLGWLGA